MFNPLFKRPDGRSLPGRSPTPPSRHVEPLSPPRPTPIEPIFNYPAINSHVDFTVRPEPPFAAATKSRNRSSSHKSRHHRTPSTIDTLAEAALALSPHHVPSSSSRPANGHAFAYPAPRGHNGNEPPHKRARSEILGVPATSHHVSRPVTSYSGLGMYGGPWHHTQIKDSDESRIEAASLLLNFRTGGIPSLTSTPHEPVSYSTAGLTSRPHANSFPQVQQSRPAQLASQAQLLPPVSFHDQKRSPPYPARSPSHQPVGYTALQPHPRDSVLRLRAVSTTQCDITSSSAPEIDVHMQDPPSLAHTSVEGSSSRAASEASEQAAKAKRRGSKARSKGSSRKGLTEKAATKRTAARKKALDRSKPNRNASATPAAPVILPRRKSFSNVPRFASQPSSDDCEPRSKSVPPETPMVIRPAPKVPRRAQKMAADIVCAGCSTTRETAKLGGEMDEWISCNGCKRWFHVDCAGFKKASEVRDVDKYFCGPCEPSYGKTTHVRKSTRAHAAVDYAELQRGVLKTSEESTEHHYIQPIKDGTFQFDPEYFPRMRPELITREFMERSNTFIEPICIPAEWNPRPWLKRRPQSDESGHAASGNRDYDMDDLMTDDYEYDIETDVGQDRLGMVMPENLTVRQVCNMAGPDTPLDVIDVKTQNSGSKWTLSRWADYYEEESEDKPIRNVISLEVSLTRLGRLLRRPQFVRDIDLQDQVWPQKEIDLGKYPKVQFYCLMSVADSYTDFHIDFGGSSVYYHILKGKKTFFFIPPKAKHLKAYEEWNDSPQQNYTFLPSITKECYRVDLSEGDTMLIPSGWIHAVWTPETSLVIGGNFLTRMSYKNQFKVVDIEKANSTPMKFRYPFFQKIMWYTAIQYLETDPLPDDIRQLFYDGNKFERRRPVWADFDGDLALNDTRSGSRNVRYYSQAEIEGLPDLVNYIFHTIMMVMGRVDGISADRMKRINASIPKGHGEPLELAKTFALWVAWKRGNEHPPAWAHPDAVLPNSKDEGPPKKLSARALKEMERKEAIAAWRVAGADRASARVKNATDTTSALTNNAPRSSTPDRTASSSYPLQQQPSDLAPPPSDIDMAHQYTPQQDASSAAPMSLMMNMTPGQYYSTPKSSVLGPKRVACDACRRRRIRCKHKDLVMQATPDQVQHMSPDGIDISLSSEVHENITVTPPKKRSSEFITNDSGTQRALAHVAHAYAGNPMTLTGVTADGVVKRGRSKACFECRKSKRRCIHDEDGNVDAMKAAENPVPRGSVKSKKRSPPDDGQVSIKKVKMVAETAPSLAPHPPAQAQVSVSQHASPPPPVVDGNRHEAHSSESVPQQDTQAAARESHAQHYSEQRPAQQRTTQPHAPHIDPSLYTQAAMMHGGAYHRHHQQCAQAAYPYQSLEQIASEVLDFDPLDPVPQTPGMPDTDSSRPDESVDSAISIPGSDDGQQLKDEKMLAMSRPGSRDDSKPMQWQSAELPTAPQSNVSALPLYQPPAPPARSPELSNRQHAGHATPENRQSIDLAKALQQDDLGLRRRSK